MSKPEIGREEVVNIVILVGITDHVFFRQERSTTSRWHRWKHCNVPHERVCTPRMSLCQDGNGAQDWSIPA